MDRIQLLVNDREHPCGADGEHLDFGWRYPQKAAAFVQCAYRILVATSPDLPEKGTGDVWDSGWVESSRNLYHPCGAQALPGGRPLYWTVLLRGEDGTIMRAGTDRFSVAPSCWQAEWIWRDAEISVNDVVHFRKCFLLEEAADYAYLYVSAHSTCQLMLNGQRLGGYVSPAPGDPQRDKRFLAFDVTGALRMGENRIDAVALYQGGGGQNFVDGVPGFWCECHIHTPKGTLRLATGGDWECAEQSPFQRGMPYQQDRRLTVMEHYNALKEREKKSWHPAVPVRPVCPVEALRPQTIPEGEVEYTITPLCILSEPGVRVFDAGRIVSGWVKLRLREKPGTEIGVRYSENLDSRGRVGHNVANHQGSENYRDLFTAGEAELEEWRPCFSYKGFRYFEVTGCEGEIRPQDALVEAAHTDIPQKGWFFCDNELVNRLVEACLQTQKNNTLGQLVDCPHREQAQYLGDSDLQAESLFYYFDAAATVDKTLTDFGYGQQEDGSFPFVYPCSYQLEEFSLKIPEYDLHFCTLLWKLYFFTGKEAYLRRHYPVCRRLMEHVLDHRDPRMGLVPQSRYWHISDWPYPDVDQSGVYLAAQNLKIYRNLLLMEKMSALLGEEEEPRRYRKAAKELYGAIRRCFFSEDYGLMRDCSGSGHFGPGVNALALEMGLFWEEEKERALRFVAQEPWTSGTLLRLGVLRVLFEQGHPEAAYEIMTRTDAPGWAAMICKGFETIWEGYMDIESHCHAWNGYPARMFAEYVAGIRCVAPGFLRVELKPYFPEGMGEISAAVWTPQGRLSVKWRLYETNRWLELVLPHGVEAEVYLPAEKGGFRFLSAVAAGKHVVRLPV